jgi:predicted aspartyl protease
MKKIITIIILWFTICDITYSQSIEQKLGNLLNSQEYFKLKRELQKTDSTKVDEFIWLLSNAMVNTFFYNSQEAIKNLNTLLSDYQEELGFENSLGMTMLLVENYANLREYKPAAQIYKGLIEQLQQLQQTGQYNFEDNINGMKILLRWFNALEDVPSMQIVNKQSIKIRKDSIGAITVPVSVGNKTHNLIFDTGASYSVITESLANDFNITALSDSVTATGISDVYCKLGIAENIQVGNIGAKNVLFLIISDSIILPKEVQDKNIKINGCIGWDFMRDLGRLQIDCKSELLSFDVQDNVELGNLMFLSSMPYVESMTEDDTIILRFDTGYLANELSYNYYNKKSSSIKSIKDTIQRIGGAGGYKVQDISIIKDFTIQIGDKNVIPEIAVSKTKETTSFPHDGVLGMPIIDLYDKMIIDFTTMSVILKND